jgi:hypothetical protein
MVSYLGNLGSNIVEGFKQGLTGHQTSPPGEGTGRPGYITIGGKRYWRGTDGSLTALALGSGSPFTGSFGEALGFEMSHKPPGSSIVIANSSETIIPAAGGFGMKAMANTLGWIQNGVNMLMRANSDAINKLQMPADTTDVNIPGRPRIGIAKGMRGPGATMVIEGLLGEAVDTGVSALFDSIKNARDRKLAASQKGSVASRYMGGLGDAISSELKNKPPGSRLAIANTSETIIPAAGGADGAGMANFVNYMSSMSRNTAVSNMVLDNIRNLTGLLINTISPISTKIDGIRSVMTSGAMRVKFMIGGTGGQGGPGAVDAFNPIASSYGLGITSGYRPGDPGYHGLNRARDYSNSTGPTSQMMAFATFMAASFGSDLAELIYTPLGFGIKNGQMVGLDYWGPRVNGMHYNHVHVAYANGPGNPAFFSSASQAAAWEEKMAPKYATVKTVTANSSEGFGGGHTLNAPITIHQQPGQDADELASLVLMRLSMAVDELTNHS